MAELGALPPEPTKPTNEDCCHSGCTPCVFDLYAEDLAKWKRQVERIQQGLPPEDDSGDKHASKEAAFDLREYRPFTVTSVQHSGDTVSLVKCALPPGHTANFRPGQHVIVRFVASCCVATC